MVLPPLAILPWKRGSLGRAMQPLRGALALSLALGALAWALQTGRSMLAPVGIALAAWLVLGAFAEIAGRARRGARRPAPRRCAAPATCRAPTGARRSPMPASA